MVAETVTTARSAVLARVRGALAGVVPPAPVPPPGPPVRTSGALLRLFVERAEDYGATVIETEALRETISSLLASLDVRRIGVPADLDSALVPDGIAPVVDDGLSPLELDELDGALTTCAWAVAETGTIALTGGEGEGRRALSLVPDVHVCVVRAGQIVGTVPELLACLHPVATEGRPIVLVSGPSATSDIGLTRVEGVHGPRRLAVVIDVSERPARPSRG